MYSSIDFLKGNILFNQHPDQDIKFYSEPLNLILNYSVQQRQPYLTFKPRYASFWSFTYIELHNMYHFGSGSFYTTLFSYFLFYETSLVINLILKMPSYSFPNIFDIFSQEIQYYKNYYIWSHVFFTSNLKLIITLNLIT